MCLAVGSLLVGCARQRARDTTAADPVVPAARQPAAAAPKAGSAAEKAANDAMQRGDVESAIGIYSRILRSDPSNGRVTYYLGYAYGQIGEHEQEIEYYKQAIDLGYRTDQVYYNLGEVYLETERLEEAFSAFTAGLTANPDSADNHFGLGRAFQFRDQFFEAERELLRAVALQPRDPVFRENLAMLYEQTGQPEKAVEQLEIILDIDPEYPGVREYLDHLGSRRQPREKGPSGVGGD
ncbi:MAG: hypothetical protein AMJ54_11610 [Deltaproteobacteria bacterium SG8_13]|nr:MAG: hypothetical protein AMJ54_11610 [Deltaproteobacteria bacterium SG8_13]